LLNIEPGRVLALYEEMVTSLTGFVCFQRFCFFQVV
jgi:hypothetical protein